MVGRFWRLATSTEAATTVEYAVILALVVLAMIGSIFAVGRETGSLWRTIDNDFQTHGVGS